MNSLARHLKTITLITTMLLIGMNHANASGLLSAKGSDNELQIKDHSVSVVIEDGYAITTVENSFFNPSDSDLEAVYQFPVPEGGTVAEFTLWIDDQAIVGEVVEKERAKELYQQEKAAGRDAGLTEQKSFFRFESKVSPVRAKQITRTRLVYMQAADIEGGIGRYVYPLEDGNTDNDAVNFWHTNDQVHGQFDFSLNLRSSFPVDAMRAPAHLAAKIESQSDNEWAMTITKLPSVNTTPTDTPDDAEQDRATTFSNLETHNANEHNPITAQLNSDLVVYWRLKPNLPGAVELVAHREPGKRRGTFMLSVTPGVDLQPITEGRDWVFVLDRSGSMRGKYQTLMDATAQTLKSLGTNDRFKIMLFSNHVETLTPDWINADEISIDKVSKALYRSQPDGGTDMYAGIKAAIDSVDADRTASIVLITDGVANLGKTEKKDFLKLLSDADVRLFTGIMGNGANRPLLASMTKVSGGFATSVSNSDDVMGVLLRATEKVKYQALHDVDLRIKGIKTSNLVPEQATTIYRGEQMVMFGHYFGEQEADLVLTAKISGEEKQYQTRFSFPKEATDNPEIERLWAYAKIESLNNKADYLGIARDDFQSAIVDTAMEFGLVTPYTSMIVMSDSQFDANRINRTNRDRRAKENAAATTRKNKPVSSNRVDQSQPAFNNKRPSYSGGGSSGGGSGAMSPLNILIFLPLLLAWTRRRKQ